MCIWATLGFVTAEKQCQNDIDIPILLGVKEQVDCRLLAIKVPDKVAKLRRCNIIKEAQRKGKKVSKKSLKLACWTMLQRFLRTSEFR